MHTVSYRRHRFPAEVIQHAVWRRCHIKSDLVELTDNRKFLRKGFQRLSLLVDRPNCANFT